ncbi:hypothetical protein [Methanocaldococcus sp.]
MANKLIALLAAAGAGFLVLNHMKKVSAETHRTHEHHHRIHHYHHRTHEHHNKNNVKNLHYYGTKRRGYNLDILRKHGYRFIGESMYGLEFVRKDGVRGFISRDGRMYIREGNKIMSYFTWLNKKFKRIRRRHHRSRRRSWRSWVRRVIRRSHERVIKRGRGYVFTRSKRFGVVRYFKNMAAYRRWLRRHRR